MMAAACLLMLPAVPATADFFVQPDGPYNRNSAQGCSIISSPTETGKARAGTRALAAWINNCAFYAQSNRWLFAYYYLLDAQIHDDGPTIDDSRQPTILMDEYRAYVGADLDDSADPPLVAVRGNRLIKPPGAAASGILIDVHSASRAALPFKTELKVRTQDERRIPPNRGTYSRPIRRRRHGYAPHAARR